MNILFMSPGKYPGAWHRHLSLFLLCLSLSQMACSMDNDFPRNQIPELFHPHRTEFTCKSEVTVAPPLDPQAEVWYQEALALDTPDLWKDDRNWPRIIELYSKAAERKHWKAMNNLATLYQTGISGLRDETKILVARNSKAAMALTEEAMRMGVPLAYAVMGNYYADGFMVKRDATSAWAFWQKAADMGSSYAQFKIGRSLNAVLEKDEPERERWNNEVIGLKMLECAFAQGNGDAAEALGLEYDVIQNNKPRALRYFHEGVKLGSARSADYLRDEFQKIGGLAPNGIDNSRADRYRIFKRALEHNPELRFPNLDKVLPLPPGKLPHWNGKPEDLIDAAKPVLPVLPAAIKTPGAHLSGRANIPQGWTLPNEAKAPAEEIDDVKEIRPQYEGTIASYSGYWRPQLLEPVTFAHEDWNQKQLPQRYTRGESFDDGRIDLTHYDGRLVWHYLGTPEQLTQQTLPAEIRSGQWRLAEANPVELSCAGSNICPQSGIWQPELPQEHPLKQLVNERWRQTTVMQGMHYPDPKMDWLLDVQRQAVTWHLIEVV